MVEASPRSVLLALPTVLVLSCVPLKRDNPDYVPRVPVPTYPSGTGPIVYFDRAHRNHHHLELGLRALAALAEADGLRVRELGDWHALGKRRRAEDPKQRASLLVLALPAVRPSTLEIVQLLDFVASGGGLLALTDHPDHPERMVGIAAAFGVALRNAMLVHDGSNCAPRRCPAPNPLSFYTVDASRLGVHPVTAGIGYVQTYSGAVIVDWDDAAVSLLGLGPDAIAHETGKTLDGLSRGVCGAYGAGRYCFFADVELFTSKCAARGCASRVSGFGGHEGGVPTAEHNERFALRTLRWLDGWGEP